MRLVDKLKTQMNFYSEDKSPERHSIHGNSPSPIRPRRDMDIHMPNGPPLQNKKAGHSGPFIGNIDGIPNRSPPRNSSSNSGGSNKDNYSPNLEN